MSRRAGLIQYIFKSEPDSLDGEQDAVGIVLLRFQIAMAIRINLRSASHPRCITSKPPPSFERIFHRRQILLILHSSPTSTPSLGPAQPSVPHSRPILILDASTPDLTPNMHSQHPNTQNPTPTPYSAPIQSLNPSTPHSPILP